MEIDAVRIPSALGSNVIVNVVDPEGAIGLTGCTVTEKSLTCGPLTITFGESVRLRSTTPVLKIVKVWLTAPFTTEATPKSV